MDEIQRRTYLTWASLPSYKRRIEGARNILRRAALKGPLVVSTSWGKDSIVLSHLALDTLGDVPLFHMQGVDMPGYEETIAYFERRATVHVLHGTMTLAEYIEWCQAIGLPHERSASRHQGAVAALKKDPGNAWVNSHGFAVQALGMRIAEGGPRTRLLRAKGPTYAMKAGGWKTNPIAYLQHRDVWAYILEHDLPYNRRIYDAETHGLTRETIRNTGWLSTDGAENGRIAWLRQHFPAQYEALEEAFPQVRILR